MRQEPFLWGVATAAYQVEGGLNGDGEPLNNWADWERAGRVERAGGALGFWRRPQELIDRAASLGCNAFRMSIEWARVQPSARVTETIEPAWDEAAIDGYASMLAMCRARAMEPVVTLHHFTHPRWCGIDFWKDDRAPARFEAYARRCVRELGRRLADRGESPVRWWLTINEPAALAFVSHLLGMFPGSRRGAPRAYDHLIAAHILAYDAVHDVYEAEGWGAPVVSINTISTTLVELDAMLIDELCARERGVSRAGLRDALRASHGRCRTRLAAVPRHGLAASALDVALDRYARLGGLRPDGAAFDALYASSRPCKLDYVAFDYYDPVVGHFVRRSGIAKLWEQRVSPSGLAVLLRHAHLQAPGRRILVAENGMCTRDDEPRADGVTRDAFLRQMCGEVTRARDEGVPVAGYLHWTLADNYEWGSYRPRFGLFGVDRSASLIRILDCDAVGIDAADAYRRIISADQADGRWGASAL
jgi:beta-glucosidase/6-phospho-beta-glucosidase/beta-galactosidase